KALSVKVETDKKEYRPGDKVNLTVQVTDKDGKPVEGVAVNLNLVDEALYNIANQQIDLLGDLYEDFYSMNLNSWRSHLNRKFEGAEQGGDGGSERQDFRDTVLFTSLETDEDGQAATEFKLPDNLTSWRLTYHAINSDILAGSGTSLIPVRLPFFVEMTNNSTYLAGDSPVIILRGYGTKIAAGQPISYTMRLIDSRGKAVVRSAKGMPFSPIDWALPKLSKGQYKLTVTGKCQGFSDTLTKPITVVSSLLERTTEKPMLLKDGLNLPGSPVEPTNLIFSDYEKSQYVEGLYRLSWLYGGRIEHKLAQLEARKLLAQYFPSEKLHTHEQDEGSILDYQQQNGGISILPYADSDLALSALVAANAPDYFDKRALKGYFENVLEDDNRQDKSLALLGLASLHEPVLLKIQEAQKADNLAPAVRINLALALLEIGNGSEANKVFRELLGEVGQDLGSAMRIKVGRDQDDYIAATTQMAVLAAHLNQPEKNKLYQYLLDNPGQDIVNSLEQLEILKCGLRYMNPQPVSFTYQLNGEQVSKTLDAGETFSMTVAPQDLKNLKFSQVRGKVGVLAQYVLPFPDDIKGVDQDLKISRRYFTAKAQGTSFSRSDIVWVELTCNIGNKAPGGDYEVEDVLPAGLVYVQKDPSSSDDDTGNKVLWYNYPCEVDGQRISLIVNKNNYHVRYAARVISPGEFTAEAPLLSHMQASQIYTRGAKQKVIIR
ncbi:MAG: alpha-2-macroglobulin family protein, partial [Candidatus Saccharibacteria bacterium]